jgi:hypothetical protein
VRNNPKKAPLASHTWANRYALASIYRYIDIDMDFEADFDIDIETHPFSIYRYIDEKAWQPLL